MLKLIKVFLPLLLCLTILFSAEIKLQNNESYSGCEDGYLSAIYATELLQDMVADTLTNHFSDLDIYLSR